MLVSRSGLVTVTGGKWTTYRAMAEDVLEKCFEKKLLQSVTAGVTTVLLLVGAAGIGNDHPPICSPPGSHSYGSEQTLIEELPGAGNELGGGLTEAMVRFAARHEYARTAEDVLARRSRLLFLDAALAADLGPVVAGVLSEETGNDPQLPAFLDLARHYRRLPD